MIKSVPDRLKSLGDIYRERNKLYGSNYKQHGHLLASMFPNGLTLKTAEDFNRFAMFIQVTHKVTRYGKSIEFGQGGHLDSCDDIAVYCQMLAEYDEEMKNEQAGKKAKGNKKGRRTRSRQARSDGAAVRHRNNGPDRQPDSEAGKAT